MTETVVQPDESRTLAGVIAHPRLILARGAGSYVWDTAGRQYLDFTAGLAVAALGHGRADLAEILRDQFATLGHVSNLYGNVPALDLAARLTKASFASRVWFANSGTEANEAALKFARITANARGGKDRKGFVAFKGGFHGRTLGALAVTYHPSYREPFLPLLPGVRFATFNNLESVRRSVTERTAAVIVEPVQGEGGVVPATREFLQGLREVCDATGALLIFDEVQCGLGRLGTLFAYESYGVVPDLVTLAKPIAAGLPLGVTLIGAEVARHLVPGQHGSTFSGGPAVCAVANRVFDTVAQPEFLAEVTARAEHLAAGLAAVAARSTAARGTRGRGLMQALVLAPAFKKRGGEVIAAARERGLLVTRAGDDAIRFLPPLVCSDAEIDSAIDILSAALESLAPRRRVRGATVVTAPAPRQTNRASEAAVHTSGGIR